MPALGGLAAADGFSQVDTGEIGSSEVPTSLEEDADAEKLTDSSIDEPTYVDPALGEINETEQILIKLAEPEIGGQQMDTDGEEIRQQAVEDVQRPVVDAIDELDAIETTNTHWISNVIVAEFDPGSGTLDQLESTEAVESILLSRDVEPAEPVSVEPASPEDLEENTTYGLDQINAPDVWDDFGVRGEGSRVAVIDTGLDPDHPDLELHSDDPDDPTYPGGYEAFDEAGDPIDGVEPISGPPDNPGHGDHVSGTVVGGDAGGTHIGVAPEAELIHGDVFREGGTDSTVIGAIEWAVENDADVISMSLGFGCADQFMPEPEYVDSLIDPIDNARDAGTAVVVSTGNAGEGCVGSPGSQYDSYGIGASNEDEQVTPFSSGKELAADNWDEPNEDWPDTWIKPDVVAPGEDVLSAAEDGEGYTEMSGTSMAAPHVSGVIALMRSFNPDADVEEIEDALNEHAEKPDDWVEPGDDRDTRYGLGIIDARASIEEMDADVELGDVTADDEIGLEDVIKIEEATVGNDPDGLFIPDRADLNRDGEIGLADSILAQQRAVDILDPASLDVPELDAPDEVAGNETTEVTATITNDASIGTLEYVEMRLGDATEDLTEAETIEREFVDVAGDGVETPSDRPAESDITFELDATDLPGDDYAIGVFTDDDQNVGDLTVREPFFEVAEIDSPTEVDRGETLSVDVDVTNEGNDRGEMDVEYALINDIGDVEATAVEEAVSLNAGETETVTFDIDTSEVDGGAYTQTISTPDYEAEEDVYINEPYFAVTDVDGPTQLFAGDDYEVDATVENLGEAPDEQTVEYELSDLEVAVVDVAESDEQGEEIVDVLTDDPRYNVDLLHAEGANDSMDDYDAFVVQRLGDNETAEAFLETLDNQGVVYLDSYQGLAPEHNWADGIYQLNDLRENPEIRGEVSTDSDGDAAELEIESDHPLFNEVGTEGEHVEMFNDTSTGSTWGAWFEDYDGEELASIDFGNGYGGSSVAVNDEGDEVLLTAAARSGQTEPDSFTEASDQLLTNAVDYVLTGDVTPASGSETTTVELEPEESETVTFEPSVSDDHDIGDSLHAVSTADAIAGADVTVLEDDFFEITDVDTPTEAEQKETIEVTTTVENNGLEAGTQDVKYVFDGEVVDIEEDVDLDVDEETTVDFEYTIEDYETPGEVEAEVRTEMDEYEVPIEVLQIDDASFDVTLEDAPETVDQLDEFEVEVDVENVGDRETTQTVEYEFAQYLSVAIVDDDPSTHGVDDLGADLDADFGDEAIVETLQADDLLEEMDDYDVLVVNNFGETDIGDFLDELGDDQGVVYIDQSYDSGSNAIFELADEREDLDDLEEDFAGSPTFYEVEKEHPIFEGVGSEGDSLEVSDSGIILSFGEYGGDIVGGIGAGAYTVLEPGIGVDDEANEVLLAGHGLNGNNHYDDYKEDALPLLTNSIDHLGLLTIGEIDHAPADSTSENVTLAGGENETVEFTSTIPVTADSGDYIHVTESDNDSDMQDFEVDEEVTAVTGTVMDADTDEPIEEATVTLSGDGDYEVDTDADGEYFVEVEPGNYVVDAGAEGYQTDAVVTLEDGDIETVDHELSQVAGDITGTVTDDEGEPIEDAVIVDADADNFDTKTTADGEFVIEDLSADTYALEASADGFEPSGIEFVEHSEENPGEQDFELESADIDELELELDETQLVEGETTDVTVTAHFSDGTDADVTEAAAVESSDESVASIDDGTITAEESGTTEIEATFDDESDTVALTVGDAAEYEVTIDEVEDTVDEGDPITVEYTVENVGDLSGEQDIEFAVDGATEETESDVALAGGETHGDDFTYETDGEDVPNIDVMVSTDDDSASDSVEVEGTAGTSIAVVDDDPTTHGVDDAAEELDVRLEGEELEIETLEADDLLDEMGSYDAFVLNHFGETDVSDFLDALGDEQGVVYLDSHGDGEEGANAVRALSDERNNPESVTDDSGAGQGELYYEVTEEHPIINDLGEEGDQIEIAEGVFEFSYFEEYDETEVAEVGYGFSPSGLGIGVDEDSEVLLSASGFSETTQFDDYVDDGLVILTNSVAYVSDAEVIEPEIESVTIDLEDDEILDEGGFSDDETEATVTASFDIGDDEDITEAATLTSSNDTVATVDDDGLVEGQEAGETEIEAEYEDETDEASLDVLAQAEFAVEIDETNDPIDEGETLEVDATVENVGDDDGSQDIDLLDFDGDVVDTESNVALDGGESKELTLTWDTNADAGEDEVTVETEDDEASTSVEIQELEGDANVAFVDDDPSTHGVDDAVVDLNYRLDGDDFVETLEADDLLDEMDEYDVLIVNNFADADVGEFLDELEEDQGTIYLDADGDGTNAIAELVEERENPESITEQHESFGDIGYHVTDEEHPVFDGVELDDGDVEVHEGDGMAYFEEYEGDVIAEIGAGVSMDDGPGVGVDDEVDEVLLGGHGLGDASEFDEFTDDGKAILGNAIEHVLEESTTDAMASVDSIDGSSAAFVEAGV